MFIHVTRRLTHEDLVEKLLAKTPIDPSATVAKIKEKLQQDTVNGADITMTSLHFSLTCPISKARMRLPCRASSCQHLQCFDAACYLKMNEKKPKWICPVCSDIIEYENLQIDKHFKNILEQNISSNKILLQADGSWKPLLPNDVNESILTLDDTLGHPTATDKECHSIDDKESRTGDDEESHHITIDLLSEDESSVSYFEDVLPVPTGTDCASSKDIQNHTSEVVILSDDESYGSPAHRTLLSPSSWRPSESEASSTPRSRSYPHKSRSRRSRMHNAKKTPKNATITATTTTSSPNTSTCTDWPGTRMVLRSHVRLGKSCKPL